MAIHFASNHILVVHAYGIILNEDPLYNLFNCMSSDFYFLLDSVYHGVSSLGLSNEFFWLQLLQFSLSPVPVYH
jgi:hypothetical protein